MHQGEPGDVYFLGDCGRQPRELGHGGADIHHQRPLAAEAGVARHRRPRGGHMGQHLLMEHAERVGQPLLFPRFGVGVAPRQLVRNLGQILDHFEGLGGVGPVGTRVDPKHGVLGGQTVRHHQRLRAVKVRAAGAAGGLEPHAVVEPCGGTEGRILGLAQLARRLRHPFQEGGNVLRIAQGGATLEHFPRHVDDLARVLAGLRLGPEGAVGHRDQERDAVLAGGERLELGPRGERFRRLGDEPQLARVAAEEEDHVVALHAQAEDDLLVHQDLVVALGGGPVDPLPGGLDLVGVDQVAGRDREGDERAALAGDFLPLDVGLARNRFGQSRIHGRKHFLGLGDFSLALDGEDQAGHLGGLDPGHDVAEFLADHLVEVGDLGILAHQAEVVGRFHQRIPRRKALHEIDQPQPVEGLLGSVRPPGQVAPAGCEQLEHDLARVLGRGRGRFVLGGGNGRIPGGGIKCTARGLLDHRLDPPAERGRLEAGARPRHIEHHERLEISRQLGAEPDHLGHLVGGDRRARGFGRRRHRGRSCGGRLADHLLCGGLGGRCGRFLGLGLAATGRRHQGDHHGPKNHKAGFHVGTQLNKNRTGTNIRSPRPCVKASDARLRARGPAGGRPSRRGGSRGR